MNITYLLNPFEDEFQSQSSINQNTIAIDKATQIAAKALMNLEAFPGVKKNLYPFNPKLNKPECNHNKYNSRQHQDDHMKIYHPIPDVIYSGFRCREHDFDTFHTTSMKYHLKNIHHIKPDEKRSYDDVRTIINTFKCHVTYRSSDNKWYRYDK